MEPTIVPTIEPTLYYTKSRKTTSDSDDDNVIVTKDGDIRIFEQENESETYASTTMIGIVGMIVCFLCFGVLMFVHSKRNKDGHHIAVHHHGVDTEDVDGDNQEMTLIDVDGTNRARLQSETIYKMDGMGTQNGKKHKDTMTYSMQSSEEQQYLPISYDGKGDGDDAMMMMMTQGNKRSIVALPEEDEMTMFGNVPNESSDSLEKQIERKLSQIEEIKRKRSRGSIVRSELKQLSKHMADVLHSNNQR